MTTPQVPQHESETPMIRFDPGLHDPRDNGTPRAVMIEKPEGSYVRHEDARLNAAYAEALEKALRDVLPVAEETVERWPNDMQFSIPVEEAQELLKAKRPCATGAAPEGRKCIYDGDPYCNHPPRVVGEALGDDAKDAARYRWLRSHDWDEALCATLYEATDAATVDAAIDAAMRVHHG